jgi:hypothetical protein
MSGEHDNGHVFFEERTNGFRQCRNGGCRVRLNSNGAFQTKPGGRWLSLAHEFPPCAFAKPSIPPILAAEWEVDEDGGVRDIGGAIRIEAKWLDGMEARALAAAPDMARELLSAYNNLHEHMGTVRQARIRAALLKAGVSEAELEGGS